ncbi:hypothetical protein GW17_00005997 [Ensete ventricosum]|nr:hypothetical protein GW17_00005997 [Ensete ventricosum]
MGSSHGGSDISWPGCMGRCRCRCGEDSVGLVLPRGKQMVKARNTEFPPRGRLRSIPIVPPHSRIYLRDCPSPSLRCLLFHRLKRTLKREKGGGESGGLRFLPRLNSPPEGGLITTLPLAVEGESEEGDGDRLRDGATHAFSAALLPGGSSFKLDATSAAAAALPDPGSCWRFICPSSSIVAGRLNAGGNPSPIPAGMHHSTPSPPQRSWREATETSARNFQLEDASDICESQPSSSSSIGPDRVAVRRLWRRSGFT